MQTRAARPSALLVAIVVVGVATGAAAATAPAGMDVRDLRLVEGAGPFEVTLRSCTFRDQRLECLLKVHNKLPTPSSLWLERAVLYDTDGAAYDAAAARLAGRDDVLSVPDREPVVIAVPADTPLQVKLFFPDVERTRRKATTLVVDLGDHEPVQFADFHFARD